MNGDPDRSNRLRPRASLGLLLVGGEVTALREAAGTPWAQDLAVAAAEADHRALKALQTHA